MQTLTLTLGVLNQLQSLQWSLRRLLSSFYTLISLMLELLRLDMLILSINLAHGALDGGNSCSFLGYQNR